MIDFRLGRYAVGVCAAVALLDGCGGAPSNGVVPIAAPDHFPKHKPFYFTGRAQDFRVPEGVTHITVVARGAHGAGSPAVDGGRVHAVIPVTPGEKLVIYVGGDASGTTAGFNGGGSGGPGGHGYKTADGYGGGGASDVREGDKLSDRIVVAGGGGGNGGATSGYDCSKPTGGKGGGPTGGNGTGGSPDSYAQCGLGGTGGTQAVGGSGGAGGISCFGYYGNAGDSGALGAGGSGGTGSSGEYSSYSGGAGGGGGGGGYYGGGGGGAGCNSETSSTAGGGGGGGGSSYVEPSATKWHMWQGWKNSTHNGLVVLSW